MSNLIKFSYLMFILFLMSACGSHKLALKDDYTSSVDFFRQGNYIKAKKAFPKKEKNGFITNTEKLYLKLISGDPKPTSQLKLAESLDQKQVTYVSVEAENFFYRETEEGYYPAEHEVIAFHVLLGYAFAKKQNKEAACVEARRASQYLQDAYDDKRSHFDDPGLRLWLAGLWTYCDEWQHAQVDIRVAGNLLNNKKLIQLSHNKYPPPNLHIALLGDGPEVHWQGNIEGKHTKDLNKVNFKIEDFDKTKLRLASSDLKKTTPFLASTTSEKWYQRHQTRNKEIREVLDESKYMLQALGASTEAVLHKSSATVVSGGLMAGGVIIGAAIIGGSIYLLVQLGGNCGGSCGELIGVVLAAGWYMGRTLVDAGKKLFKSANREANQKLKNTLDVSNSYRFVRYLPEKIYFGVTEHKAQIKESKLGIDNYQEPFLSLAGPKTNIHLYQWTP